MNNEDFNLEDIFNLPDCDEINRKLETREINPMTCQAFHELVKSDIVFLSKSDYLPWLEKYKLLFEQSRLLKNADKEFEYVFMHLLKLTSYFRLEQQVEIALKEFQILNQKKEIEILRWLVKYEKLGLELFEMGFEYFDNDRDRKNNFVSMLTDEKRVYYNQDDFKILLNFQNLHNTFYWDMLQKYTTDTKKTQNPVNSDEEIEESESTSEQVSKHLSLHFHLLKRKII